jgi:ATP-dependent DNA ligase
MAKYAILKAVEFDKCSAKFKKQWKNEDELWRAGWLMQKKYDGCFGMAVIRYDGGSQMLSRTGEDYTTSCINILEELREAADEQSGSWDDFVVLGEVWHPTWDFPKISGKFRKREVCDKLVFVANDLLPPGLTTDRPYSLRLTDLKTLLPEILGATVVTWVAESIPFDLERTALGVAADLKAEGGFDGAILRDCRAPYSIGLANAGQIVKVKPNNSLDLRCVNFDVAEGEKTGRAVVTLVVQLPDGKFNKVGSGVPHDLSGPETVGQIVEVEFMGCTPDGYLREPRFKGVRFDKEAPDQ